MQPSEWIIEAVARGWCSQRNERKTMDPALAEDIAKEIAASLLSLADEMERAEPVAWVSPHTGKIYTHDDLDRAKRFGNPHDWAPLYTHPALDVQRDAQRYRWLRDHACYRSSDGGDGPVLVCRDDDEDAAIDAAMQEPKP